MIAARCSRAGCTADAISRIEWRNPRLHDESRRKVWLACADHVGHLERYLRDRGFPVQVTAAA